MGFFSKPDDAPHTTNTPLTKERIAAFLTRQEWYFSEDSDGDLGGAWDDNVFYFFVLGSNDEVLQVRGRWKHTLPLERQADFLLFADDFHRSRPWPKAYTAEEGGELAIYTEVSFDLEYGVADDQLGQFIASGLFTGLRFFEALGEHLGIVDEPGDQGQGE